LNRLVLPAILAVAFVARADQPELGQLDASPTLFTVMAAINAAGYDADVSSPNNHPLRDAIRAELAKRKIPSLPALKDFFQAHKRRTDTEELSQYISFALTASGPPSFAIKKRDVEVPPDVTGMMELSGLLEAFYKEANIDDLWRRSQPSIDQYIQRYHSPVVDSVLAVNAYLRQQTSGFRGRHFQIFVELQSAPNQVQTRSYGDEYFIVIAPSPEPRTFDVRHAYLHYLLDPLATRSQETLNRKKPLMDQAQRARALPDAFKEDFLLLATESLIKAIEARLDHSADGVQQALLQGYILTPYFAEQLPVYEKQEQSMLLYYPELVGKIDNYRENTRLDRVNFNTEAPSKMVRSETHEVDPPALTGAAKTLDDAEKLYVRRDLEKSKNTFLEVLKQTDQKPQQAAAYYGLGRIALLQKDPETAEKLLLKAKDLEPDPFVKGWTLVYLGKLSLASGDPPAAAKYLNEALKVEGASQKAREEATKSLQGLKQ
jgi:tetratricopeptide (TPR) repeat protein